MNCREIQVLGVPFDSFTFPCVCGVVEDMHRGAEIHGLIIKRGYDSIVFVANSLVSVCMPSAMKYPEQGNCLKE